MLDPREVRVLDRNAEAHGVTVESLMENAGREVAFWILERHPTGTIGVLCGSGNNGGDGLCAARHLLEAGRAVRVGLLKPPRTKLAKAQLERLPAGIVEADWHDLVATTDVLIDALLGSGLQHGQIRDPFLTAIAHINIRNGPIVSIDVPSGLGADQVVLPTATLALHDSKDGMSGDNSGDIAILDIGIPMIATQETGPGEMALYREHARGSHKGQNGRLLIVAGGPYHGAPHLSAMGALASGVDLVFLYLPTPSFRVVAGHLPDPICRELPGEMFLAEHVPVLMEVMEQMHAILIGPGLGRDPGTLAAVRDLAAECGKPLVIDADALHALREPLPGITGVVTPHRAEYEMLTGRPLSRDLDVAAEQVGELADTLGMTVLAKGPVDLVSDGNQLRLNRTGHPVMTGGGTGDVLAGLTAGLLAMGLSPFQAARLGCYMTGRAGEIAFETRSHAVRASDVAAALPLVYLRDLPDPG